MGGVPYEEPALPRGHGPPFGDLQNGFAQLNVDDKRVKDGTVQRAKSMRRVSFDMNKTTPKRYEFYSFTKRGDWTLADRIKIPAPQEELEKTVLKRKKAHSVLGLLTSMSPERRAQIDRLLNQRNLDETTKDAEWHCVFIETPASNVKEVNNKRILEHKKMNVIIAQRILSGRASPDTRERSKSFVGERSDISEPLKVKEKPKVKENKPKEGKEGKNGSDRHDDPFDSIPLFNNEGVPVDKHGHAFGYPPVPQPQQFFDQGMRQPLGQPLGQFQPTGPHVQDPLFGNPFSAPQQGHKLPNGIEIIDEHGPAQPSGKLFNLEDIIRQGQVPAGSRPPMTHHNSAPHFQKPNINDFDGPGVQGAPLRQQQPREPPVLHSPFKGRHHHRQKWVNDDSSHESDDDYSLFDEDEHSSHTSFDDHLEKLPRRGSLVPHRRRSSTKRREPTYREHHRGSSYPLEQPRRLETSSPHYSHEKRYHDDRFDTIIERGPRHSSRSRERRKSIKYIPHSPRRLEYHPRTPPLTPNSTSSGYSLPRRYSGLPYPHELERERDRESVFERLAEEYMRGEQFREFRKREDARRERDLDDREFFEISGRGSGRRYYSSR